MVHRQRAGLRGGRWRLAVGDEHLHVHPLVREHARCLVPDNEEIGTADALGQQLLQVGGQPGVGEASRSADGGVRELARHGVDAVERVLARVIQVRPVRSLRLRVVLPHVHPGTDHRLPKQRLVHRVEHAPPHPALRRQRVAELHLRALTPGARRGPERAVVIAARRHRRVNHHREHPGRVGQPRLVHAHGDQPGLAVAPQRVAAIRVRRAALAFGAGRVVHVWDRHREHRVAGIVAQLERTLAGQRRPQVRVQPEPPRRPARCRPLPQDQSLLHLRLAHVVAQVDAVEHVTIDNCVLAPPARPSPAPPPATTTLPTRRRCPRAPTPSHRPSPRTAATADGPPAGAHRSCPW